MYILQNRKRADARRACVSGLRQVDSSPAPIKFPEKKKFISKWGRKRIFQGMVFIDPPVTGGHHIRNWGIAIELRAGLILDLGLERSCASTVF